MKKKIIIVVTIIFLFLISWFTINNPFLYKNIKYETFYSSWMDNIKDEVKLQEVVMPGSHDAGSVNMMPQASTQGHSIYQQLQGGVRYFDIRVTSKNDELVIFHGPIKGQKFSKVVNDFKTFIEDNKSEFVIIDFQHLENDVNLKVIEVLKENLNFDNMLNSNKFSKINEVDFKLLRENKLNFMIVWKNEVEALNNGFYTRKKSLLSQYSEEAHKGSDPGLIKEFITYYDNYDVNKLFVLQAQKTSKTYLGRPSFNEILFNKDVSDFIKSIKDDKNLLDKTNIIMRDYIISSKDKINNILSLNIYKDNVKEDKKEEFSKQVIN